MSAGEETDKGLDPRRIAATDFEHNLVILAGAGTGKTSLLVERILVAIGSGRVSLPSVAAITFGEKAAAELRGRLALGLERLRARAGGEIAHDGREGADRAFAWLAGEGGADPDAVAARALVAFGELGHATVDTIHGFCAGLLHAHPREAGVDPGFEVDVADRIALVFDEAWNAFLARELGPGGERRETWAHVLQAVPMEELRSVARGLSGFGIPEGLLGETYDAPNALELYAAEARELRTGLPHEVTPRTQQKKRQRIETLISGLETFLAGGDGDVRRRIGRDETLRSVLEEVGTPNERRARHLLRGVAGADEGLFSAVHALLAPFALEFRERGPAHGLVGYEGLLALTWKLLRDNLPVREALKRRYRMILVDEFQDTDPLQYEIVLFLAERPGGAAVDPYQADLEPGRLCVVGDPKQSIYRFRGADYEAFRRATLRVIATGGRTLPLEDNFRSDAEVLAPINALFQGLGTVWSESEYQPVYAAVRAARGLRGGTTPAVEVWTVDPDGKPRAAERRETEAVVLAREIRKLVDDGVCAYREITVLLRAFVSSLRPTLRALREQEIPFVVGGGSEFLQRPEVGHLLAVLRAVAQPGDCVALLAFLRSPAGAVADTELAAWAASGGRWDREATPDPTHFPELSLALAWLRSIVAETAHLPVDGLVRRVLAASRLLPLHACAPEGPQRVANLRKLAAGAAALARDGRLSLLEVVGRLEEERGADLEGESPLADEAMDAVQVLTVHKAKGLENRIVFIPDLARQATKGPGRPQVKVESALVRGRTMLSIRLRQRCNTAALWHQDACSRHEDAEELRVLYVALTRARERLVLMCGVSDRDAAWMRALQPWGYRWRGGERPPADGACIAGGSVRHRVLLPGDRQQVVQSTVAEVATGEVAAYTRAVAALRAAARPPFRVPSALEGEERPMLERGVGPRSVARAVGSVVHRMLERWDPHEPDAWQREVRDEANVVANEEGVDPDAVEDEARTVLEGFAGSPMAVRFAEIEIVGREVPLLLEEEGSVWRGSIDLLYRDRDGTLVVADYKTDRELDEAQRARHQEQLGVYARAVQRALSLPTPPRTEFWLLRQGRA